MTSTVFRSYDQASLDREYDNAAKISPDTLKAYRAQWAQQSARARDTIACDLDLPYGNAPGERLDIFRPAELKPAPVHIYIHGGYWISNDKNDCSYVAHGFVGAGFVNVIINYGLIPSVDMAEQVRQCRAAVRWVARNIHRYGGDPDQIYVTGHSAGGHLALMLLCDPQLEAGSIKGVTSLSGLYDLEPVRLSFVNQKIGLSPDEAASLSPIMQTPRDPSCRLLLTLGDKEGEEYLRQMNDLAKAWCAVMPSLTSVVIPNTDHFSMRAALDDPASHISRLIWEKMGAGHPPGDAAK